MKLIGCTMLKGIMITNLKIRNTVTQMNRDMEGMRIEIQHIRNMREFVHPLFLMRETNIRESYSLLTIIDTD